LFCSGRRLLMNILWLTNIALPEASLLMNEKPTPFGGWFVSASAYLAPEKVRNRFTLRDFLKQDNLKQQQQKFVKRGTIEIEALQKVKHVIGRTTWASACTYQINPDAKYHFCNEILKGLHFMLEAMPLILKRFPDTKLYVGGQNITKSDTLKDKLKISSYGKYIKESINKNNLQKYDTKYIC
jgi:hypothetical protein